MLINSLIRSCINNFDADIKTVVSLCVYASKYVGSSLNLDKRMSQLETFFALGFTSTLAVALMATGYRYLTTLTALYKILVYQWSQPIPSKYALDNLRFCSANDGT